MAGIKVGVGPTGVLVGGTGVAVEPTGVDVGVGVLVGGKVGVLVGGTDVGVLVGGTTGGVLVGGTGVDVGMVCVGVSIGLWAETGRLNNVPTSNIKRAKTDKTRLVFMEFLLASGSPLESVAFDYKLESAKSGCRFGYNTVTFHPVESMGEP